MPATTIPERFQVSTQGMRQLHADRHPEQLIKELVQNAFDEETTTCDITLKHQPNGVLITVEDDGPGFSDISHAYTLMADTPKRLNPEKRGRFNMGDKEVISLATWATIETTGSTVRFPRQGGRKVSTNTREIGTKVTVHMPWSKEQSDRLKDRLPLIRPPETIRYTVNGIPVTNTPTLRVTRAILPTIVQPVPGQPMRPARRSTEIHIAIPGLQEGWLYEMGIPIQPINLPYDVDIMQKVPMPPNRDTVSEAYLKDIYTEVLAAMYQDMEKEQFADTWVRTAMESNKITEDAVKTTIKQRYGDKVVTWSSKTDSNMKAIDNGYEVIHPRTISKPEMDNMRRLGGLQTSNDIFPPSDPRDLKPINVSQDQAKQHFARWVTDLGGLAGKKVEVKFTNNPNSRMLACCTMNTSNPTMFFNTGLLEDSFFEARGQRQLELVIHELGHAETSGEMSHGPAWGTGCSSVASKIAHAFQQGKIPS